MGGLGIQFFSVITNRKYRFLIMISKDLRANFVNKHRKHKSNANATNKRNKKKKVKLQHPQDELSKLQGKLRDNERRLTK